MATVTIEVPNNAFAALRRSPKEFAQERRMAAPFTGIAGSGLQGKAAEIARAQSQRVPGGCSGSRTPLAR